MRSFAGTNSPLRAVAIFASVKPSSWQRSSSVPASVARASPFTVICKDNTLPHHALLYIIRGELREYGRHEKSVPVAAIDGNALAPDDNLWRVVGEAWTEACRDIEDARFAQGWDQ